MLVDFIKKRILISESRDLDHTLIMSLVILLSIGLVMVTSATLDFSYEKTGNPFYFTIKHLIYICIGLASASIISRIPLNFYNNYSKIFLFLSFLLSLVIFIPGFGREVNGALRWLDLRFITIQVAELSRLFILIWICSYISRNDVNKSFNKCLLFVGALALLIVFHRDLGSIILLITSFFALMLIIGLHIRTFFSYFFLAALSILPLIIFQPYRMRRITSFLNPWDDPTGSGYQLMNSLLAFGKGGFFGLGLGSSVQKLFYLPESYNDFIFALIAEELGLVFTILIVVLFYIIFLRIFKLARKCLENELYFASNLSFMIGLLITIQAIIHIMVNIGMLPTKGMGLPFISYGGTNLLVMFICIGLLFRIQIENRQKISQGVQRGY